MAGWRESRKAGPTTLPPAADRPTMLVRGATMR
jgi:hypothetical protein